MPHNNKIANKIEYYVSYLTDKIDAAKDIDYEEFLRASLLAQQQDFSPAEYIQFLCMNLDNFSNHVVTNEEFAELTPVNIASAKTKDWLALDKNNILKILSKFKGKKVWLIESRDHVFHTPLAFNDPDKLDRLIYKKTHDYTFALMTNSTFQQTLAQHPLLCEDEALKKELIAALIQSLAWLNSNIGDFNDLYKKLLVEKLDLKKSEIYSFVDEFSAEMYRRFEQLDKADQQIINGTPLPDKALIVNVKNKAKNGVLITTSSSGGCHKTIAANVFNEMKNSGINCGLINESILTQDDVCNQFLGIAFAQLYPVVHQQNNMPDYRCQLIKLNRYLSLYKADNRPALLRQAINEVMKQFNIGSMYVTSQYEHNLRFLPTGAQIFYQVCDYGPMPEGLQKIADAAAHYLPNTNLRFLVPSETTRLISAVREDQTETFRRLSLPSLFPTAILDADTSELLFDKVVKEYDLSRNPDIIRATISMGGCGCSTLLNHNLELILNQYANRIPQTPLELSVVCGNNNELAEGLKKKYEIMPPDNPGIRVLGMVPNPEYISLAKHSVLITKPGGGTISECLQNKIVALMLYDPNHPWEAGNVAEMEYRGLGRKVADETLLQDILELGKQVNLTHSPDVVRAREKVSTYITNSLFSPAAVSQQDDIATTVRFINRKP